MAVTREHPTATRPPLLRVSKARPCPVCGKADYCGVSADGGLAVCMRTQSAKESRNGGWVHRLHSALPPLPAPPPPPPPPPAPARHQTVEHKDRVFRRLLGLLTLSDSHRRSLLSRGLTARDLEENQYRSAPESLLKAGGVARSLSQFGLSGVPGFYREDGQWRLRCFGSGILIPYRDPQGRIQALQLRRDTVRDRKDSRYLLLSSSGLPGGASSGTPLHFRRPEELRSSRRALITEGALKADVIASQLKCGVIALTGVSCFREGFGRDLRRIFPNLREVAIAFDSDWREKPQVKAQLFRLMRELSDARLPSHIWTWSSACKGLDDYLTRGKGRGA